ncbi:response regulator transcription factor [Eubacteriales bacterium OttesenSCG-928-M02]|nr:response regulator transcription factor [Eubacteriales bacterium OttesenSCG-928-M02]
MEQSRILVVEDDADINGLLVKILLQEGYSATGAYSGTEAMLLLEQKQYDLLLLDLMLPGYTGEELIASVREKHTMPIVVISAKSGQDDKINVLHMGADDFIQKPFDNREVLARVEAQLRRYKTFSQEPVAPILTHRDLTLNRDTRNVYIKGQPLSLTAREFGILALLMEYPQKVFTRANLFETVWQDAFLGDDNTVNVHISNLRAKISKVTEEEYIKTVWGIGFKMAEE